MCIGWYRSVSRNWRLSIVIINFVILTLTFYAYAMLCNVTSVSSCLVIQKVNIGITIEI